MARLSDLEKIIRQKTNKTVRTVARNIVNGLAEAGPVWSGEFRDSWVAVSASGNGRIPASYPYKLSDIPELPVTKREMNRVTKFIIINETSYAMIALDLASSASDPFKNPGSEPEGDVVATGLRPKGGRRGDVVSGKGNNRSTAPLDWYRVFVGGGKMQRALKRGITAGFK